jgi:hypothetical protein
MQLAMLAILSDIADELGHFNKRAWCDGLTEKVLKKRINTLNEFALFPFDTLKAIQVCPSSLSLSIPFFTFLCIYFIYFLFSYFFYIIIFTYLFIYFFVYLLMLLLEGVAREGQFRGGRRPDRDLHPHRDPYELLRVDPRPPAAT